MQKLNFQNLPSTTTPINATNLNAMQTNVEDVFNGNVAMGNIKTTGVSINNVAVNPMEDTGWIDANLSSNVSNYYLRPKYRKIGKIVQVIGEVDCTDLSQNAQILTGLPQPVALIRIPTSYSDGIAQTYLNNNGTLCCVNGIGNTLFLNFVYLAN